MESQAVVSTQSTGGAASDGALLASLGVTHVLTVMDANLPRLAPGRVHKFVSVNDWPYEDLKSKFAECNKFIDEGRTAGGVLVHCRAGRSRSATVVIAYLMWKTSLTYESAYQKVLAVRLIQPNSGFIQQLREYEAELVSQRNRQDV
eukprot:TRINITY_DN53_c0_g1_i1.p1 TRINITY_DN53_c0_g1~~TRINITY_DN53_c0_g1_i1.p1  ORF type:complete len:147 (-),score=25.98 TRINITY_DN53_c0_g1_i1:166-606(-)